MRPANFNIHRSPVRRRVVLHSENGPLIGGSDFYLGRIIDALLHEDIEPCLMVRPGYPIERITSSCDKVHVIPHGRRLSLQESEGESSSVAQRPIDLPSRHGAIRRVWGSVPRNWRRDVGLYREIRQARTALSRIRPLVFHSVDGGPQPTAVAARQLGCRVMLGYSAPPPDRLPTQLSRWLELSAFQAANVRIVKSHAAAMMWSRYLKKPLDQFRVIPNGIDAAKFCRLPVREAKQRLGLPDSRIVVGLTTRLEPEKGVRVFLEVIRMLNSLSPGRFHFVIAGEGSLNQELANFQLQEGNKECLTLLGRRNDIPSVTAAYDIAVVPSIWNEPFGWVVLEAMAAGKPLVASNVGGIPEIVIDRKTGWLTGPGDATEIVAAISALASDTEMRREMGLAARQHVQQNFSLETMLEDTMAVYFTTQRQGASQQKDPEWEAVPLCGR